MRERYELEKQIQKNRELLNNKLLKDIINNTRNNIETLRDSCELDKLIVEYMKSKDDDF